MPNPIYTPQNCHPAYQLDWSYSVFWHHPPPHFDWFSTLQTLCEPDGIRLLQHQFTPPNVSQFLVSTQPQVAPLRIAQRVKGRLQHLLRPTLTEAFRRNYALRGIGSTRRDKLEQYLAGQLEHHPTADPRVQQSLARFQIHHPEVDLGQPRETSHARYWYNLHVVLVNDGRWREVREERLQAVRDMIERASRAKGHTLSRAAVLPDHIHMTLGYALEESPEDVVMSYLNNLAYVLGMKAVFMFSYYVGTFSEYDLGVIPRL